MRKIKNKIKIFPLISAILIALLLTTTLISLILSKYCLKTTEIEIYSDKIINEFTAVQITDLHAETFGTNNKRLIGKIEKISPDIIFMTGDMISEDGTLDVTESLLKDLSKEFIVYFSLGNHEKTFENSCIECFTEAGAKVLEKEYADIEVAGNKLRIGGLYGYALGIDFWSATYYKVPEEYYDTEIFAEQRFMIDYSDTNSFKIMLLHRPEAPTLWSDDGWYDVDLVLSGHTHGGLIRIPFSGGLYAPEEGFFPDCEYGLFEKNGVLTYVSSGLSGAKNIPRLNNIPEIVKITFKPLQKKSMP